MSALRWAVVGFGDFGARHATVLGAAGHDVVAVVDPDPARRAGAEQLVPMAVVTADLGAALATGPDAVVVATPEHLHLAPVVESLAVAPVLVEKPIASTLPDAEAMMTAAASGDRLLFVGHLLRFDPRLVALRALIADGGLGAIVHVACRRIGRRSLGALYQRVEPLVLSGVHDADLVAWLSAARPQAVSARSTARFGWANPEHQVALIELDNGGSAVIEAGWLLPDGARVAPHVTLDVVGTEAAARMTDDGPLTVVTDAGTEVVGGADASAQGDPMTLLRSQCDHVVDHIARATPSECIGSGPAAAALRTMLAAAESARHGGERTSIAW